MNEEQFIQKAREYLQGQLQLEHHQWEYDGAKNFGEIASVVDITVKLDDDNPNVRIQAARVLRLYDSPTNMEYVIDSLCELADDKGVNKVSSEFQADDDEVVYVAEEVKQTIDTLVKRR